MTCTACGTENRDGAKFCLGCGDKLAVACPTCGRQLPSEARFCDECGTAVAARPATPPGAAAPPPKAPVSYTPRHLAEKILTTRSAIEGERKQVAVLFADVVGSTPLAERLDPEDMHDLLDRCFRLLLEEVHRYEGTVNQFTGDGIMALFGAPIAHEDASERAVRAALGMQASLRQLFDELRRSRDIEFRMRIGINTGPVVVGSIGDDLRMDYTAVGDTTNLAARLQTAASPGSILISEHTAKLVARRFELAPVGPLVLKGKSRPVNAFEVIRLRSRAPLVAPSPHGLTPLVGRTAELDTLMSVFAHARAGSGQIAFVVGEAGIGKSRLLHELRTRLEQDECTWLEGRCISFGRGMPFLPIIDWVKHGFGIEEGDDERAVIDKVHRGLEALGPTLAADEPYLRALLAVDPGDPAVAAMDASGRRFSTFDALKRLMIKTAEQRPLALLIEDFHWIDPASEEFLTYVADALAASPVLILGTYRPGYRSPLEARGFVTRIALQPLTAQEASTMAAAMLDASAIPAEIRGLIEEKAEGNPFFIEEVTKSLLEIGALRHTADGYVLAMPIDQIVVPDTIQDVIMARIDRLDDEAKRAIQVASVIGREFAVRLLQRTSELGDKVHPLVGELRSLELIYEKAGLPELAYMFKHALTHDVAYESLLVRRRRQLHQTIGLAIEELYADRLSEHFETLAHHFYRAEDWERAFAYLVKAGDKALASFANREAVLFYDRALEIAGRVKSEPMQRCAILEGKGRAHQCLSQAGEAFEAFRAALAFVVAPRDRARLKVALAETLWFGHEFDAAIREAEEAAELAVEAGDRVLLGKAKLSRADVFMVRGDLETAGANFAEAKRIAAEEKHSGLAASACVHAAMLTSWRGEYADAIQEQLRAMDTLRGANELLEVALTRSHLGISLAGAGEYARALAVLEAAIAEAEAVGDKFWRARMWNTRGWILGELGAHDAADEANHRCLEIALGMGSLRMTPELVGNAECNLADLALGRGDAGSSEVHLATVAAIIEDRRNEWMTWRYGMHYNLTAAETALARGDLGNARRHIEACLLTARRTRSRRYLVRANRLLASCQLAGGDAGGAERLLRETVDAARSLGNPPQLWQALHLHGRALEALGRRDEAALAWRSALQALEAVQAKLPPDLRSVFAASSTAAALREAAM